MDGIKTPYFYAIPHTNLARGVAVPKDASHFAEAEKEFGSDDCVSLDFKNYLVTLQKGDGIIIGVYRPK